ncbi:MAG: aminotransferase class V-fold PLP-dependent enzyme, partial [Armatimonadetes bacterium]|nr:aminotransferase class V-fold PLP-dependent enzyme [Armatimonadota bacterium]
MAQAPPLHEAYRHEFPVRDKYVFLNHAGVAPLPARTARALQDLAQDMAEGGGAYSDRWARVLPLVRQRAANLLGCQPSDVALVKNTTHGLLLVAQSIPWCEGDNIVAPGHEFPANIYPWMGLRDRGVSLRLVGDDPAQPVTADDLVAACDSGTRAIAVSWVQFANGYRIDLERLSEHCRRRGIYLIVDAIQGLGAVPWAGEASLADFIAADGHKWLLSVEGCGLLYVNPGILDDLVPAGVGWQSMEEPDRYLDYTWRPQASATRFEEGSHNLLGATALAESLGLLLEVGIAEAWQAIGQLTAQLDEGMKTLGARPRGSGRAEERSGIR